MCIRDRINRKESIGVLIGAAAGLILGLLIGWVWWPVEWQGGTLDACLLYTSDAADERSSVDLGGRRIIKKKNEEKKKTKNNNKRQ